MKLSKEYVELFVGVAKHIALPEIRGIHLPSCVEDSEKPDEFGFVFLDDGSTGPFYTSLSDTLEQLWKRYPDGKTCEYDTMELIQNFTGNSLPMRALALGAINAVSQHIMRHTGYLPYTLEDKSPSETSSTGISRPNPGDQVGMIGYFCPLIDKFLENNIKVLVIEKNPDRVELKQGVTLSENASDLIQCEHVLCTASTLINGTLEDILHNSRNAKTFSLIGPSGSGLPDVLFKHGVDAVGGIHFHDYPALNKALSDQESWGHAGRKYQLTPDAYPGVETLIKNSCLRRRR